MYYALFDEQGNRITSIVQDVHFEVIPGYEILGTDDGGQPKVVGWEPERIEPPIPDRFIPISDEEQALYATNEYIRGADGAPVKRQARIPTIDEEAGTKLAELDQAAAQAYVSGFYSEASGTKLYYDSDTETQKLLDGIYTRTKESDWETKVRYPGVSQAGQAPIRAKPQAGDPDSLKTIQFMNAAQIKVLVDDLDGHLFAIKSRLWLKQGEVKTAYDANDIPGIKAVSWNEA